MSQKPPISQLRLPLFTKLVVGFIVIILFMVLAGVVVVLQLKTLFSSDQSEFRVIPMAQQIEHLFDSERELAIKYFQTHDPYSEQTLVLVTAQFNAEVDSLRAAVDKEDVRVMIDRLRWHHQRFEEFLDQQSRTVKDNPRYDAVSAMKNQQALMDSIRSPLRFVKEAYIPTLSKSLKKLNQRTSDAMTTANFILLLALAVGTVFAFLLARNFTRPIQSLKAGTQKVAEGHYETVPITSNDEIADLTIAFNVMSERLRQLDEMRMQMMSEISHEMRTPLQVIKAGCYTIIHAKDGPPLTQRQREAVGMIHQSTNRINQFVNSFLDVAKMEAGLMKFNFEESDLVEVLSPLVQEAQLIAQNRQIKVEIKTQDIPKLRLDRERISQVFSNLLSNALKYTPDNGSIMICIERLLDCDGISHHGKGCVKVDVQDTGVGIPEDDLQKLFNKFYQAKNVPLVNEKGSGLGLALVKHVAEAHGGRVSVESTVGAGSTFTVLIPI
ncbi:MAG: HAMP domain-containing protein [Ignavibacteriae bacterium]|nr:HAMP domain-containing protein [Ignavibacteria bacterium]MBI3363758.1 HAMP domain-containing protein [Ignavibacteriota bacterium]